MESVKSVMNCIGVSTAGNVSILGDFFGFFRQRLPTDPIATQTAQVSLLSQMRSLQGRHIHLNIIRVGIDNFTAAEVNRIDFALYRARQIYQPVNMGIGRIEHYDVTSASAGGKDDIGSDDEAEDLTHDWTVPNNGLDVFMVDNISARFVGLSPRPGPCDKDDKNMNGVLGGEVNRTSDRVARTFAHEVGHYLGLPHNHGDDCPTSTTDRNNLMAQTRCAISDRNSVVLTTGQRDTIREHCSVQEGC